MSRRIDQDIHSARRTSGTPQDYVVPLRQGIPNASTIEVESIELPNSMYGIPEDAALVFSVPAATTATVPKGNYTAATLVTALNTAFAAASPTTLPNMTAAYDSATGLLTISDSLATFTLDSSPASLGLPAGAATGPAPFTLLGTSLVNISTTNVLYLQIAGLESAGHELRVSGTAGNRPPANCIARVQMPSSALNINFYREQNWQKVRMTGTSGLNQLHVRWFLEDGSRPDFNNVDHSFNLRVTLPAQ